MPSMTVLPVSRADAADLIEANVQSRDYHAPWMQPFATAEGFDQWFGKILTGPNLGFVARAEDDGRVVGVVAISEIVWGFFRSAYLSYYGNVAFARTGLMSEAVRRVITMAFDDFGLHRLEANIQPGNYASIALVKRLGFRLEGFSPQYLQIGGEWRDHERWAMTAPGS